MIINLIFSFSLRKTFPKGADWGVWSFYQLIKKPSRKCVPKIVSNNVKGITNRIFHSQIFAVVMLEKFWISEDHENLLYTGIISKLTNLVFLYFSLKIKEKSKYYWVTHTRAIEDIVHIQYGHVYHRPYICWRWCLLWCPKTYSKGNERSFRLSRGKKNWNKSLDE